MLGDFDKEKEEMMTLFTLHFDVSALKTLPVLVFYDALSPQP